MKLKPLSTYEIQSRKSLSVDQALDFLRTQSLQPKQKDGYQMFIQTDGRYLCLKNANLSGAVLSHTDLSGADLSGVDLSGANLSGANLSGANLTNSNLLGAILDQAILDQTNLVGADLRKVLLDRLDLRETFLAQVTLEKMPNLLSPLFQTDRYLRSGNQIYHFIASQPPSQSAKASKCVCIALHGYAGLAYDFDWLAENLEMPTRAIHLSGHHSSTYPDMTDLLNDEQFNEKRLTVFDQKVDELADVIDQILSRDGFEKMVLIGYSMGARLALALGTHLKLQSKIQQMILMGAHPGLEMTQTEDRWHQDLTWIESLFRSKLSAFLKKWYKQAILSSFEKTSPHRFEERLKVQSNLHHSFGLAYAMYAYSLANQPNLWSKLNQIKIPVLWLNGALDLKFCEIARQATLLQDTSIAVEIQGFGHQMIFECPELVLEQILLFLRTHQ